MITVTVVVMKYSPQQKATKKDCKDIFVSLSHICRSKWTIVNRRPSSVSYRLREGRGSKAAPCCMNSITSPLNAANVPTLVPQAVDQTAQF